MPKGPTCVISFEQVRTLGSKCSGRPQRQLATEPVADLFQFGLESAHLLFQQTVFIVLSPYKCADAGRSGDRSPAVGCLHSLRGRAQQRQSESWS